MKTVVTIFSKNKYFHCIQQFIKWSVVHYNTRQSPYSTTCAFCQEAICCKRFVNTHLIILTFGATAVLQDIIVKETT